MAMLARQQARLARQARALALATVRTSRPPASPVLTPQYRHLGSRNSCHATPCYRMEQQGVQRISTCQSRSLSAYSMEQDLPDDSTVLVRDFIHSALYHPNTGYFSAMADVVGTLEHPLSFDSFSGRREYLRALDKLYKNSGISWFTPVELFQPWYGFAIAEYILQTYNPKVPLKIYEIGGGTGTCALNILDYIKARASSMVYDQMTYTSVEISGLLAEKQMARVGGVESHRERFRVENRSALERSGWGSVDTSPCIIIMLEVLDNLPHDLVCKPVKSSSWMEVAISGSSLRGDVKEVLHPLEDRLIKQCLDIAESDEPDYGLYRRALNTVKGFLSRVWPSAEYLWIPTGCLQLLQVLHAARPNMSLIAADFNTLPGVKVVGKRAPLVATKKDGLTVDLATYLNVKGEGDIFFPTDFSLLQKMDHLCNKQTLQAESRISHVISASKFLEAFADASKTETRDGYNPLLEDFSNTSFYLSMREAGSVKASCNHSR